VKNLVISDKRTKKIKGLSPTSERKKGEDMIDAKHMGVSVVPKVSTSAFPIISGSQAKSFDVR